VSALLTKRSGGSEIVEDPHPGHGLFAVPSWTDAGVCSRCPTGGNVVVMLQNHGAELVGVATSPRRCTPGVAVLNSVRGCLKPADGQVGIGRSDSACLRAPIIGSRIGLRAWWLIARASRGIQRCIRPTDPPAVTLRTNVFIPCDWRIFLIEVTHKRLLRGRLSVQRGRR